MACHSSDETLSFSPHLLSLSSSCCLPLALPPLASSFPPALRLRASRGPFPPARRLARKHRSSSQVFFDGENFLLRSKSGFQRMSDVADVEDVSYVSSPFLPDSLRTRWGKPMVSNSHRAAESSAAAATIRKDLGGGGAGGSELETYEDACRRGDYPVLLHNSCWGM
eukprot:749606-Hanusia_phi.AAC.3